MNINRDYLIINDVKKSSITLNNGSMFFYITDKNTQNIFVNLVINVSDNELIQKYANIENAEDYTLTMNIVKPDNDYKIIEGRLHDKEKAIFEFDLKEDCVDKIGTYKCELLTKCNINGHEEITTSNSLTYKVNSSILNDLDDIVEAPEYPVVIQLFDKLSDIDQYEEDRRANELARQLAEEQRQTRFNTLDADMVDRVNAMNSKMDDVENRISAKEQAVDKLIVDTKIDIDDYKVAKDTEIDEYKTAKDTQINQAITNQDNKIDQAITNQNNKIDTAVAEQNNRIEIVEASDNTQNTRLDAIEAKNQQQDDRLLDVEKVNKRQDMDLKCLFAESKNNMIDITEEGNSVYLQNSTVGYTLIDEIQGNTMVNCNKEADKELILNGNINTQGYSNVTLTEGVDGGLVDVALEGNTMVNVCDQKDPVAITKSYTVETGNHVALQGEYDGKCRPVVSGNTLVNIIDSFGSVINAEADFSTGSYKCTANGTARHLYYKVIPKTSTTYTAIAYVNKNTINDKFSLIGLDVTKNNSPITIPTGFTGLFVSKFTTKADNLDNIWETDLWKENTEGEIEIKGFMILEGDYTNKPIPDYFTGLKSSFEDKVVTQEMVDAGEELAENLGKHKVDYVVTGKNKINKPYATRLVTDTGDKYVSSDEDTSEYIVLKIQSRNEPFGDVAWSKTITSNTTSIGKYSATFTKTNIDKYLRFANNGKVREFSMYWDISHLKNGEYTFSFELLNLTVGALEFRNFQLEEGSVATPYEPYKEYTKAFYLNSPLLEGDTIEQQGDNVVHVHRYSEVVLDGSSFNGLDTDKNGIHRYFSENYICPDHPLPTTKCYCDKLPIFIPPSIIDGCITFSGAGYIEYATTKSMSEAQEWLNENPTTVVYKLATPQYEVISQNDTILCDSYVNGHLDVDSVVPIERVDFLYFEEELTYLYANTQYTVQFVSDAVSKVNITLGGAELLNQDVVLGINKYTITTPSELIDNNLVLNGEGFNASNIVVTEATDQDFGYFEGMKSVGECEDLEVVSCNSDGTLSNTQTLTHEPLRAVGDTRDRYVLIDGKWFIERNCGTSVLDEKAKWDNKLDDTITPNNPRRYTSHFKDVDAKFSDTYNSCIIVSDKWKVINNDTDTPHIRLSYSPALGYAILWLYSPITRDITELQQYLQENPVTVVYQLETPTYEPIDYNPFTVYSDITHISNNSTIPCNMTIKNTGYNCLLKPSTTYTVSSNLGLNTVTTPSVLSEDCLRFYDTDTSTVTTMNNVTILEGDYTTGKPIPSHFSGIESAFEQEYDEAVGKYKVKIRVQNEDTSKENYIEFYINEPLRGMGDVKDKVYVKNDKVVVERNCGQRAYQDGDFGTYLTDKVNTVYPLAEPTYEEVEYDDVKLFIELFKNSTLFYNSNIPVTSKVHYSYSVPIVDTVAQTADISNQQDSMIIDLATQVAVMEMMLM